MGSKLLCRAVVNVHLHGWYYILTPPTHVLYKGLTPRSIAPCKPFVSSSPCDLFFSSVPSVFRPPSEVGRVDSCLTCCNKVCK